MMVNKDFQSVQQWGTCFCISHRLSFAYDALSRIFTRFIQTSLPRFCHLH